jgi:dihydrodipicolinate synthase/N-acetylneuraminate lyase
LLTILKNIVAIKEAAGDMVRHANFEGQTKRFLGYFW